MEEAAAVWVAVEEAAVEEAAVAAVAWGLAWASEWACSCACGVGCIGQVRPIRKAQKGEASPAPAWSNDVRGCFSKELHLLSSC